MNAKDLRKQTTRYTEHEPCEACGKHKEITHLHHVVSLKDCAMLLDAINSIETPMVFLCPNCHTYIHQMHKGIFYNARLNLSEREYLKLCEIVNLRENVMTKVIEEIGK